MKNDFSKVGTIFDSANSAPVTFVGSRLRLFPPLFPSLCVSPSPLLAKKNPFSGLHPPFPRVIRECSPLGRTRGFLPFPPSVGMRLHVFLLGKHKWLLVSISPTRFFSPPLSYRYKSIKHFFFSFLQRHFFCFALILDLIIGDSFCRGTKFPALTN